MCFAPQRRALFQHLNCQKWSEAKVFCTFWLQNVLRATTACTFSTSQLPKVVRPWCVLYILTSKCASRHNGVQIFISHLASWLRTRRFSEPTFRPSGATDHWKNTVFRDFPTFSRICVFCPLTLSLLIFSLLIFLFSQPLPCSAFHLSILSEVWLLNFDECITLSIPSKAKRAMMASGSTASGMGLRPSVLPRRETKRRWSQWWSQWWSRNNASVSVLRCFDEAREAHIQLRWPFLLWRRLAGTYTQSCWIYYVGQMTKQSRACCVEISEAGQKHGYGKQSKTSETWDKTAKQQQV